MAKPTLGIRTPGVALEIDIDRLVAGRALLTANSGAGKSWALRRILEQTHGSIQQLVIDPEGEFYTLRERFDYVLAGRGGDCAAEPRSAALLARRLLELGVSAILDLYELAPRDRVRFVRAFVEALVDAPKALWHPVLVVVDEAHAFAPEKGHGEAESTEAIARLMAQGRKRGFAGVLATQRLAKLAKDVAAEANNLLVGRAALDVDLARAGDSLGFPKSERHRIRSLKPGRFFAFGPALCPVVDEVTIGPVETSHPRAGAATPLLAPPRAAVQAVLAELADIPAEAEQEARSVEELRAKLRESEKKAAQLERDIAAAVKSQIVPDLDAIDREKRASYADGRRDAAREVAQIIASATASRERAARAIDGVIAHLKAASEGLIGASDVLREPLDVPEISVGGADARWDARIEGAGRGGARREPRQETGLILPRSRAHAHAAAADGIPAPRQRILDALAWLASVGIDTAAKPQLAALSDASPRSSAYANNLGALRSAGMIDYGAGGVVFLTDAGRSAARHPERPLTAVDVQDAVMAKVTRPQSRILGALIHAYPKALLKEQLASNADASATSSAFANNLGALRSLGFIEYPDRGIVRAAGVLFLEA